MNAPISRYGDTSPARTTDNLVDEQLERAGFTVLRNVLSPEQLGYCRSAIDAQLEKLVEAYTQAHLASIGELDIVRAPLVDDEFFLRALVLAPEVLEVVRRVIGSYYLLHLQNAIVNRPSHLHHQA